MTVFPPRWQGRQTLDGPQSIKSLLSGPLQKKFAGPWKKDGREGKGRGREERRERKRERQRERDREKSKQFQILKAVFFFCFIFVGRKDLVLFCLCFLKITAFS
jgi:hypothetical protein